MSSSDIKLKIDNNVGDYYVNVVAYIEALIEEGNRDIAFDVLKEELAQPYVPQNTLDKLEDIFDNHYVKEAISRQVTIEECREALKNLEIDTLVARFYTVNLRLLVDEIVFYLANCTDYISSSILLYTLIDQGVEIDFEISKFGKKERFNTIDLEIIDGELLKKYNDLFESEFAKTPSFVNYCMDLLNYYFLVSFPFKLDYDFELFTEIVNYVKLLSKTGDKEVNKDFREIIEYEEK